MNGQSWRQERPACMTMRLHLDTIKSEEVGHCMLPYIRDQILELVNDSLNCW